MKKIICLFLSFIIIFSVSACKDNSDKNNSSVNIEDYAKIGIIPECEYKLGDSASQVENTFKKKYNEDSEFQFDKTEGELSVRLSNGKQLYYYIKDKVDKGISYIVTFEKAFGFDIGTVSLEIENSLDKYNYKKENLNSDNGFFMLGEPQGEIIKCDFSNYTLQFVFIDNALCATTIYVSEDW